MIDGAYDRRDKPRLSEATFNAVLFLAVMPPPPLGTDLDERGDERSNGTDCGNPSRSVTPFDAVHGGTVQPSDSAPPAVGGTLSSLAEFVASSPREVLQGLAGGDLALPQFEAAKLPPTSPPAESRLSLLVHRLTPFVTDSQQLRCNRGAICPVQQFPGSATRSSWFLPDRRKQGARRGAGQHGRSHPQERVPWAAFTSARGAFSSPAAAERPASGSGGCMVATLS
jgi:hypothetical protein